MDLEAGIDDLDSLNKNDFLPLLSQNIKQELFDTNNEENICDSPDKQVIPKLYDLRLLLDPPLPSSRCGACVHAAA